MHRGPLLIVMALTTGAPVPPVGAHVAPCQHQIVDAKRKRDDPERRAIDPGRFFRQVVQRYRGLVSYTDSVHMTQTVTRGDGKVRRTETDYECRVDDEGLDVRTPGRQLTRGLAIQMPTPPGTPISKLGDKYDLWLAPHMKLRYAEEPLEEFRDGVEEGFTAADAAPVRIDDKPMIQIKLKSGDGLSEDCEAEFDVFVNSESMLVERIEGAQRLPGGGSVQTTFDITPDPQRIEPLWPSLTSDEAAAPVG